MGRATLSVVIVLVAVTVAVMWTRLPSEEAPDAARPATVTIIGRNLALPAGEDEAIRIGFTPRDVSVRVIATLAEGDPAAAEVISLCPLAAPEDPLPPPGDCRDASSGVRETVVRTRGLGGLAIVRRTGSEATLALTLEYTEASREVSVRLPVVRRPADPAACEDNACNPLFQIRPTQSGAFEASVGWDGGEIEIQLLQGRVLARAATATGLPYRVAAAATGASPLSISSQMQAPGEYTLVLVHPPPEGTDLRTIRIDARWP